MSRFVSPNLALLPAPDAIEVLDGAAVVQARLETFQLRAAARGVTWDAFRSEADPALMFHESGGDREIKLRQRVNNAVQAVLLATASGTQLDHLAALYGISRKVLVPAQPDASPPVAAVLESDAEFRLRIALAPEAFSTAGPEGAYLFHALEAHGDVLDAGIYSEEDGAYYADGVTPVLAPEVLVVVLSRVGTGLPSDAVIAKVLQDLSGREVRPIGDKVVVEKAQITPYAINAVLKVRVGADQSLLVAEATARVAAYVAARRRVGAVIQLLGIGAALKVTDVEELEIISPADDVDPGSNGAGYCTSIVVTAEAAEDTWR